jgi:ABC-2 type transport system permease protein
MTAAAYTSTPARLARATVISRTLKAEWTKLRTLPSTWRTAALTVALSFGFGVAVAFSEVSQWHTMTAQQRQVFDPTSASMSGS